MIDKTADVIDKTEDVIGKTADVIGKTADVIGKTQDVIGKSQNVVGMHPKSISPPKKYAQKTEIRPSNTHKPSKITFKINTIHKFEAQFSPFGAITGKTPKFSLNEVVVAILRLMLLKLG